MGERIKGELDKEKNGNEGERERRRRERDNSERGERKKI
jgi:hypothetical protein